MQASHITTDRRAVVTALDVIGRRVGKASSGFCQYRLNLDHLVRLVAGETRSASYRLPCIDHAQTATGEAAHIARRNPGISGERRRGGEGIAQTQL